MFKYDEERRDVEAGMLVVMSVPARKGFPVLVKVAVSRG